MTKATRGRREGKPVEPIDAKINEAAFAEAASDANMLAINLRQIAEQYGDGQDYDRTRVVHETLMFMSASSEAMLQAGKRLTVIRENEPHGEFLQIVEGQLGINKRTAQQMMQAAVRYLSPAVAAKARAPALLGLAKTKLLDLMVEPEETILGLLEGGTVAGLKLDEIDTMTSMEFRVAMRKDRQKHSAAIKTKDQFIANQHAEIAELKEKLAARQVAAEALAPVEEHRNRLHSLHLQAVTVLAQLVRAASDIFNDARADRTSHLIVENAIWETATFFAQECDKLPLSGGIREEFNPGWADNSQPSNSRPS